MIATKRVLLALALLATAACGSTVPQAARPASDGLDEFTNVTEAASAAGDSSSSIVASGATKTGGLARAKASTLTGTVTTATVAVGIRYPSNSNGLITSVGFSGVNPGDSQAMAQAVVDDINGRGGIAGRRIAPLYFPFDVSASIAPGGSDSEQQKACAAFTEDNKVFAVVSPIVSGDVLQACLAKRGVVFVDDNWNYFTTEMSAANYWDPAYPNPLRSVPALVDRLVANGFFPKNAKVGVVYQDLPSRQMLVDQALRPALVRHGLKLDSTVAWTAARADALAGGVVKFRAAGVTHVFVLDPGGLETFGWMTAAESQGFHPKYALDTRNYPFLQQGQSPANQLINARGIGWIPAADVGLRPSAEMSPAERRCLAVIAKAGQNMGDATNVRVAFAYCDTLEFLKAAAGDGRAGLSLASIKVGGEGLLDRYTPTGTFSARFGPRRHDGASAARDLVFDGPCRCFRYTGPVFSIG